MKRTFLILTLASSSIVAAAQTVGNSNGEIIDPVIYPVEAQDTLQAIQEPDVFQLVEIMPSWKGCDTLRMQDEIKRCTQTQFLEYLNQNLQYPQTSRDMGIEGVVYINCIIEPDGSITNVNLLRGVHKAMDNEAMRLIEEMPNWNPGTQRGRAVRVSYNFPIRFRLSQ